MDTQLYDQFVENVYKYYSDILDAWKIQQHIDKKKKNPHLYSQDCRTSVTNPFGVRQHVRTKELVPSLVLRQKDCASYAVVKNLGLRSIACKPPLNLNGPAIAGDIWNNCCLVQRFNCY